LRVFYNNLGVVLLLQGELDKAQEKFEEALAAGERSVGADHPDIADYVMNIGNVLMERRDGARAKEMFDRAMLLLGRDPAQNRRRIAMVTANVAFAEAMLGDLDAAERDAKIAEKELAATFGPKHPHIAGSLDLMAQVALQRGDLDAAARHAEAAEAIVVGALGGKHPLASLVRVRRGAVAIDRGELAAAVALLEPTVAELRGHFGEEHPDVATATAMLAEARIARDPGVAATELAAVLPRLRPLDHHVVGRARFALARALWESSGSRSEAIGHARAAQEALTKAGDRKAEVVRGWIDERD
jgi:tetratricopeptide (TPR) repeat protein